MTQSLTVHGMSCDGCETTVRDAVSDVSGVTDAVVERETDSVAIDGTAETDALVAAIEDAGYQVSLDDG